MLTVDDLKSMLNYYPHTGIFRWRGDLPAKPGVRRNGRKAGSVNGDGYRSIKINQRQYKCSRLAWLYVYGEWPKQDVDHINRDRLDDRIENLREASESENKANSAVAHSKQIQLKGVYSYRSWGPGFFAVVTKHGKRHKIGPFNSAEEAHAAYVLEAKRLYGEFAHDGTAA